MANDLLYARPILTNIWIRNVVKKDLIWNLFFTKIYDFFENFLVLGTKIGEKKDFYIEIFSFTEFNVSKIFGNFDTDILVKKKMSLQWSFFSPRFLCRKFWKIFQCIKLGEKKDVLKEIFFFTKFYAKCQKFFKKYIKLGEKKDLL